LPQSGVATLDAWKSMRTTNFGGANYFITFIINHFRFTTIYLSQHKSLIFENFPILSSHGRKPNQKIIIKFHMDNGGEFFNKEFKDFFYINEILRQFIVPYIP
jgi:hypothetical protein